MSEGLAETLCEWHEPRESLNPGEEFPCGGCKPLADVALSWLAGRLGDEATVEAVSEAIGRSWLDLTDDHDIDRNYAEAALSALAEHLGATP